MKFAVNVGSADRVLRLILGLALIAATVVGVIGVWGWVGVVLVLTSSIKFCPIYAMLGLCTEKRAEQ